MRATVGPGAVAPGVVVGVVAAAAPFNPRRSSYRVPIAPESNTNTTSAATAAVAPPPGRESGGGTGDDGPPGVPPPGPKPEVPVRSGAPDAETPAARIPHRGRRGPHAGPWSRPGPHRCVSPVQVCPFQYRYCPAVHGSAYQPADQLSPPGPPGTARRPPTVRPNRGRRRGDLAAHVDRLEVGEVFAHRAHPAAVGVMGPHNTAPDPIKKVGPARSRRRKQRADLDHQVTALVEALRHEVEHVEPRQSLSSAGVLWVRTMKIRLPGPSRFHRSTASRICPRIAA